MQLVQFADAVRLSGLTPHQLREWCGRRGVVAADVLASGRGRHALYSWQTILALRILHELNERFGSEVGAWKLAIGECQALLKEQPFPSLFGKSIVFRNTKHAELVSDRPATMQSHVYCPLDPHLDFLSQGSSSSEHLQLPLIAAVKVQR